MPGALDFIRRTIAAAARRALAALAGLSGVRFAHSIRQVLLLITGALTLVIVLLCLRNVLEDSSRLVRIRALHEASALSDQVFSAVVQVGVERDLALSMLYAQDPVAADALGDLLGQARAASDEAAGAATAALAREGSDDLAELRARFERGRAAIVELRPRIDATAGRGDAAGLDELSASWSTATTGLMADVETLWNGFSRRFTDVDSVVTQHLRFKTHLRVIADYTGRERSIIGRIIAENADPTLEQTTQLLRGAGTLELSWRMSRLLAEQSGLYPAVSAALTDAESHFATMHDMSQATFYVPGARLDGAYPIGPDLWFELTSQAAESLDALQDATRAATNAHLDALMGDMVRAITVQAAILLAALALCGYSFWLILARVIRPIHRMIDALLRVTRGEPVAFAPQGRLDNEIGKLADVLDVFQRNVEKIQRQAGELDTSEKRLRAVVDHASDGLITIDSQGVITAANPACERIFGYAPDELIGRPARALALDVDLLADLVADADAASAGAREIEARRRDGSQVPIDLSVSTYGLDDGAYYSAIVRDITARKRAEETLLAHTRALERSNRELDDFAYIASHDLKEPLRGISNHSRFLLEDNAERLDEESARRLNRLIRLSQRMEQLVNDLLYFSRLGRQELAVQPTDMAAVVRDVEDTLEHFLQERNATIVVVGEPPVVRCDQPRVAELCRNLIINAVKYNDSAEKRVEVGYLATAQTPRGAGVRDVFYVKDNGRGIDPQFHQDVFRIFRRLQSDAEEGSGVGLTFAKKIVERHGGEIWLQSRLGEGATFFFTLAPAGGARPGAKAA